MASRKNGDIRGFFRPGGTSNSQAQKQPASSPLSTSDLSPPPDLPSSPRTPAKRTPRVFGRDEEIKGSDDSEVDSDDSLGSITGALGYRASPASHRRDPNILSTPQAKRIASGIHRSPLTLQPKRHKFDLKALMSHSREIERTEESFRKADALIAQTGQKSDNSDDSDAGNDPKRVEDVACQLFVGSDDEDGKGDKIRRAFKRSKDDETSSRKHCYFFNPEGFPPSPGKNTFPRKKATGRWKCLSQSDARRQAFVMGLPYTFLAQGEALPDELFQWILDEICRERNPELRRQYILLTELCEDNTARLVDDMRLYSLLEGIGGPKYAPEPTKLRSITAEVRPEYLERNWTPLVAFLQLLERIAPGLQMTSAISAVQLLLHMSLDPVVAAVVREHYTHAITALVTNLAKSKSKWNTACEAICSYIYKSIDDLELKLSALLSIPSTTPHLVDLRRRIAAESLFAEPGMGGKPIDAQLSFERIRDRLDEDDFKPTNKADPDFERLRVLTTLLDIVIDRAAFMRPAITTTATTATTTTNGTSTSTTSNSRSTKSTTGVETISAAPGSEEDFNAQIDILASRVKTIHDKIRDKASRKNLKLGLLGLEKRLRYAVRTKPPPKKDIFAFEGPSSSSSALGKVVEKGRLEREREREVPKQRDFMRQWALKKKADAEAEETENGKGKGKGKGRDEDKENTVVKETIECAGGGGGHGRRRRAVKNLPVAVG